MTPQPPPLTHQHRSWRLMLLVLVLFFLISLLTNIMGPLIPETIRSFNLSLAAAGLLPFAFFLSYGLVSIPAGMLGDRTSAKKVLLGALALQLAGTLMFPSMPSYATALISFFLIGVGSAALQVVINPLLRVSGGEEHYAFYSALAQFIFGSASFLAPQLYSYLVLSLKSEAPRAFWLSALSRMTPADLPWVSVYWVFALLGAGVLAVTAAARVPRIEPAAEEKAGNWSSHRQLFGMPLVL